MKIRKHTRTSIPSTKEISINESNVGEHYPLRIVFYMYSVSFFNFRFSWNIDMFFVSQTTHTHIYTPSTLDLVNPIPYPNIHVSPTKMHSKHVHTIFLIFFVFFSLFLFLIPVNNDTFTRCILCVMHSDDKTKEKWIKCNSYLFLLYTQINFKQKWKRIN